MAHHRTLGLEIARMDTPELVIQRQLHAYNAKDADLLTRIYANDAEMYEHPATLLAKGSAALRERFQVRFNEPNLKAVLLSRIVLGNTVIDHEEVHRTFPEGTGKLLLVMIYQVSEGRIAKAWAISGSKILDPK